MKTLEQLISLNKHIRVIGFDDAPFQKHQQDQVNISGIICNNTRFEGMLWQTITQDGFDSTEVLIDCIKASKFYSQINVVLLDGIAFGGFNIIDLPRLACDLERPCIAVMRKQPDLVAIKQALQNLSNWEARWQLIQNAGVIHSVAPFYFQVQGTTPDTAAQTLAKLTDQGHVPEALRIAHLIGSAIKTGESSRRA
ncbi:DUF99 family protein [Endozoicomonas sp. SM1973]|uniref:DUF99 family protein n=1 Tax=Spartinivicinus marinus TaxID=2994442 RepID=A0A853I191_9GAMM|nr:DUF99 family protein [Spartinivicinus marinus]MCX4028506.1 DUF99 family protein [Spartinivicinus marinus]NYZ67173.1 DUF99 family protein [Spartinivicinus marinus]